MKFTLSWLKEHLDTTATLAQVRDTLTMLGLEVEGITNPAESLKGFVVGYVIEAVQHPNADRLRVCKVDTGGGTVQVVCGAPNARTGMKGIFAPTGSFIPGTDMLLKASKIRGEDSNGMLCSSRELQLGDDHSGIIDLPAEARTGAPAAEALGLDDPVIEIKVTPNRADCLGVHGIARDLAAAGLGTLKPVKADGIAGSYKSPIKWTHGYEPTPDSPCPIVVGRHFRGLRNGPSPDWLQRRLKAIGLRPISTLVDITNLVTFDLNRPLHVFDAKKLAGDLVMRQAREGEQILALDGKTYTLDPIGVGDRRRQGACTASAASWAARIPACARTRRKSSSRPPTSSRSASPPRAASSASCPTRAIATSAASIPNPAGGAPKWRPA